MRLSYAAFTLALFQQLFLGLGLWLLFADLTTTRSLSVAAAAVPEDTTKDRAGDGSDVVDKSKKLAVQWTQNEEYVKIVLSTGKFTGTPKTSFGRGLVTFAWNARDGSGKKNKFELKLAEEIIPKRSKWSRIEKGVAFMLRKAKEGTWQKLSRPGTHLSACFAVARTSVFVLC